MNDPKLIVVDAHEIIRDLAQRTGLYDLYRYFPLQQLIETLLFLPAYLDDREYIWETIGKKLEDYPEPIDYIKLEFYIELIQEHLDQFVRNKVGPEIDTGNYCFKSWIGNNVLVLEHNRVSHETNSDPRFYSSQSRNFTDF